MELVMPAYKIRYLPKDRPGCWGFTVLLPENFTYHARKLPINRQALEQYARETVKTHGYDLDLYSRQFCNWEGGGLLHHLIVPGNAAGLVLELDTPHNPSYSPHNIDGQVQMSMCLATITRYLDEVQYLHF